MTTRSPRIRTTFDFTDAVVLVTGGGTGIGEAIARAFLDAGAVVVVTGRRADRLEQALDGYPAERAVGLPADLSVGRQVRDLVDEVVSRFGRLDVVVSNAAAYESGSLLDLDDDAWERLRATNVDGFFHLAKAALPHLAVRRRQPRRRLLGLRRARRLGAERVQRDQGRHHQLRALPGPGLGAARGPRQRRRAGVHPDRADRGHGPRRAGPRAVRRTGSRSAARACPADIAPAVLFLASSAAGYVTGAVLPVDGGTSASTGQPHLQ